MNKLGLCTVIGMLCLTAACSRLREPTDAQLATLLTGASPAAANAPFDTMAVECLRSWSGDADLLKGLSMRVAGEDGQKTCRGKLDGLLADTARNPDKFSFEEVTAPKVVRRAMELQNARRLAAAADNRNQIPAALTGAGAGATAARPPATLATPDPNVDLGVSGTELREAETLCTQAQQAAADPQAKSGVKRFAAFCAGNLRKLRNSMEQAARSGQGQERLSAIAVSAKNIANTARQVLAEGKQ
jgi:hypothetical protein